MGVCVCFRLGGPLAQALKRHSHAIEACIITVLSYCWPLKLNVPLETTTKLFI
jgi:hypothetical protein